MPQRTKHTNKGGIVNQDNFTAQVRFDSTYITAGEIVEGLAISRSALLKGIDNGMLPDPIRLNISGTRIWERATVQPHLDAWKTILDIKRKARAA